MNNLGSGVSRVLDPTGTQYSEVILQQGKPPCDAEFNLLQELATNFTRQLALRNVPSGWLGNETNPRADFITNPTYSNWLKYGPQRTGEQQAIMWAAVNGWLIPVTGTRTGTPPGSPDDTDTFNVIALDPPPSNSGDFRIDFAFLEVWLARIPPNPATLNKPASSAVYRYGNVEGGNSFIPDDIIDPALGFETSERVQLQYRIRVSDGLVGLSANPDGFDPSVVKAQGTATTVTSFVFQNMRSVLGDPGLWRAGDGTVNTLGTVDGYSYAIPLCAIFRRNGVTWNGDPSQNLNGALNRNPTAIDRTGIATFSGVPTLSLELLGLNTSTTATLVAGTNFPLPATPATPITIQIDDEIMTYTQVTTGASPQITGLVRGFAGTRIDDHKPGAVVTLLSGRPDGLFADQIAATDVLDLRHLVNPNGFDYTALLKSNMDRLLRGQLRANWKRSGAGPQGPFILYQDKITAAGVSLGVTKLDAFDGIRQIFSDAATTQRLECVVQANSFTIPAPIAAPGWSLLIAANHTTRATAGQFNPTDVISIPVAQLKGGVPGSDADQIRWIVDNIANAVKIRIDGTSHHLPSTAYTVTGSLSLSQTFGPNDDLIITLGANFPAATTNQLYITLNVMYGPGRGLSRRPDALHSMSFIAPATILLVRPQNIPANNQGVSTAWAPLWGKYRNGAYKRNVPVAAESYADLGSKTVIVSPFRSISLPSEYRSMDGYIANPWSTTPITSTGSTTGSTLTDTTQNFATSGINPGDVLILTSGPQTGRWTIITVGPTTLTTDHALPTSTSVGYSVLHYSALVASSGGSSTGINVLTDVSGPNFLTAGGGGVSPGDVLIIVNGVGTTQGTYTVQGSPWSASAPTATTLTLDRNIPSGTGLQYLVVHSQGLMPLNGPNGTAVKWALTDPLALFSGTTETSAATKNVYVTLPRHLVPSWGAYYVPILPRDAASTFSEGVNFMSLSAKGATFVNGDRNYVPYSNSSFSYGIFSTLNLQTSAPATYNTQFTYGPKTLAGMRKFTDTRGLGRQGLEMPPFYGVARLFAVYEANNYKTAGSAYDPSTRNALGTGAVNLLRQNMSASDGPTFWIEIDADGDSTFILNANALNLAISPNPIASFASGDFVIEASIFGFDRGSFDTSREFRMVMTRPTSPTLMRSQAADPLVTNRYANNIGVVVAGPTAVLQGPATGSDSLVINYSRTPYQGDAWGSQTNNIDIGQAVGPLSSSTAFQLSSTKLTESALTRPNTKLLEVLAATSFATTMGTGRISGDVSTLGIDFRDVGYENPASYPPASGVSPRPVTQTGNFVMDTVEVGTSYLGASERLPLGALWRDKDFRGGLLGITGSIAAPVVYFDEAGVGTNPSNLAASTSLVQNEVLLDTASTAPGTPGDLIAHVDGEPGNYSLLVNFRTYRGGSLFTVGGGHPGGEVAVQLPGVQAPDGHTNVIEGRAYLVRNAVTNVGATEVSPGGELMLLVATNVIQLSDTNVHGGYMSIGTNGTGEGYAAADLYRIEGHPMMRDNVRVIVDPTTIVLSKRSA